MRKHVFGKACATPDFRILKWHQQAVSGLPQGLQEFMETLEEVLEDGGRDGRLLRRVLRGGGPPLSVDQGIG